MAVERLPEDVGRFFEGEIGRMKAQREAAGYAANTFIPTFTIFGYDRKVTVIAAPWQSREEATYVKHQVLGHCRRTRPRALVLSSDALYVLEAPFCAYVGIPVPTNEKEAERFNAERLKGYERFGEDLGDWPKQLVRDALLVNLMGPGFESRVKRLAYAGGPGDSVLWLDERAEGVSRNIIPQWWT